MMEAQVHPSIYLHNCAMQAMQMALSDTCISYDKCAAFLLACELERQAAANCPDSENEPSKGILLVGAASLAMMALEYDLALEICNEARKYNITMKTRNDVDELRAEIFKRISERH